MRNKDFFFEPDDADEDFGLQALLSGDAAFFQDAPPLACEQTSAALAAFFDGEATPEETRRATLHLQRCQACRALLGGWRHSRELLLAFPARQTPPLLLPRILLALRFAALRESQTRSATRCSTLPNFDTSRSRDVAPSQLMQSILGATAQESTLPESRVLAAPQVATRARKTSAWRGARRSMAPVLAVFLVVAAALSTSMQHTPPTDSLPILAPAASQRAAVSHTTFSRKNATRFSLKEKSQNEIRAASTRAATSFNQAMERVATRRPPIATQDTNARSATSQSSAARDELHNVSALNSSPAHRREEPRFVAVKPESVSPRTSTSAVFANLSVKTPRHVAQTMRAPSPKRLAKTVGMALPRARKFAFAPRLTTDARSSDVHDRIARHANVALPPSDFSPAAPRVTPPDALSQPDALSPPAALSPRTVLAALPRNVSAPSSPDDEDTFGSESDAVEDLRATTNSYRAALDDETESDDAI